jgi:hypothetical protein
MTPKADIERRALMTANFDRIGIESTVDLAEKYF